MCGHDLRVQSRRKQRLSWIDVLLVLAVLAVLGFWWRIASQPRQEETRPEEVAGILPTNIPLLDGTLTPVPTTELPEEPTPTPVSNQPSTTYVTHIVRNGETLLAIAGIYGVTVEDIQAANNLTSVLIRVGDELIIPVTRPAEEAAAAGVASRFEYTVQSGDTIISIALQFGSTVDDILAANGLTPNSLIRPGDVLIVPVPQVPPEVLASATDVPPAAVVNPGQGATPPEAPAQTLYIEPRLLGPPDNSTVARNEAVLLRWISVEVLDPNEWYVLLLYPLDGIAQNIPSIWTKATSYRLETHLAPQEGEAAGYAWQVSVVRVRPGVNNQYALEPASPPSEVRRFVWR